MLLATGNTNGAPLNLVPTGNRLGEAPPVVLVLNTELATILTSDNLDPSGFGIDPAAAKLTP